MKTDRISDRLETGGRNPAATVAASPACGGSSCREATGFLQCDMVLEPISRRPIILPESTVRVVGELPAGAAAMHRPALHRPSGPADASGRSPRASIVVVARDNLIFTKLCLESVIANSHDPDYELIVVDNGSGPELRAYLDRLRNAFRRIRVIRNETNRGFAAASNQGLAKASGDRLVLLNNDTIVPHGWLSRLIRHLDDPTIGAVGPVTNRTSNEAQVETSYRTYGELERFARESACEREGARFDIPMLTMFCLAMRRDAYEQVGPLDEEYDIGTFEDDDYAMRLRGEGFRLVCAEDVFVHHFGGASLGNLMPSQHYQGLLNANRGRFERKWGIEWRGHRRRPGPAYRVVIDGVQEVVRRVVPEGSRVLVVSRGDPDLLDLPGRDARHFPQGPDGSYLGYHPADDNEAIGRLHAMRREGPAFFLIPGPSLWWLEYYPGLARYLAAADEEYLAAGLCVIFRLSQTLSDARPETPGIDSP